MFRCSRRCLATDMYNCLVLKRPLVPGGAGLLSGTTFVAKDNFTTTLEPTSCGSRMLQTYTSPFTATAIKLLEKEGLVLVGKSNMDEFGMGSSSTNSVHGPVVNPRHKDRIAGGSSGGSAAAVAAGLVDFSLGTDTGGSVRQPASYCGIVGFKPSYGRISRHGVVAYAQGFDTVGIMARDVATTQKVFEVLDKFDENDVTSLPEALRGENETLPRRLVVGVPREFLLQELSPETLREFQKVLVKLMENGHTIAPVSVPAIFKLLSAYYTLATAEAALNLARYDGVRYGHSGDGNNRSSGFGPEVQRRIMLGNYTLSSESGNHYLRATRVRAELVEQMNGVFRATNTVVTLKTNPGRCDVIVAPTSFGTPPTVDEYVQETDENFLNGYINDVFTIPASMAGIPAISVPCQSADYGIQIMAQYGHDSALLQVARTVECT